MLDKRFLNNYPRLMWVKKTLSFYKNLKYILSRQLKFKGNLTQQLTLSKKILVPIIETSHYQYLHILIVAKALQIRGADVKILLCGSQLDGCELKSSRTQSKDPCLNCRFNTKEVVPLFQLDTLNLVNIISDSEKKYFKSLALKIADLFPEEYYYEGINLIPMVNDSVIRYFYGKIPDNKELLKSIRHQHLTTAIISLVAAKRINESFNPDIIFNNMQAYTAWEPYYKYFSKEKKNLSTSSISAFNYNAIVLNLADLFLQNDRYDKYKKARTNPYLNENEKDELMKFINNRINLKADTFKNSRHVQANQDISTKIAIDSDKRNIFLFSNIYWDVGLSETGKLFDNVIDWVYETIDLVKNNNKCHLYIKTHPFEKYGSNPSSKGIADFIYEKYPDLPPNVTLILPEFKITPYQLFPFIDLGVLFNGTLGLEMLLQEIPVVVTGLSPYGGLGLVQEPDSTQEYENILLGNFSPLKPSITEVYLFAYFYFIKSLIPWTLTKQAWADDFNGFTFDSLDDMMPGKDRYLDHICNCILDPENTIIEGWE